MPWQRNGSTQDLTATVWKDMLYPLSHAPAKITNGSHLQFALSLDFHYQSDREGTSQRVPPWDT